MERFDVIIIGDGVVGSAVARELTRFTLRVGVLEKTGRLRGNFAMCAPTSGILN